jgi:hypothetical protein
MTTLSTPEGISRFRLASIRGQLKLERLGMKSSGGALRPRLAKELGLKPRDSHDVFIAEVQRRMDAMEQEQGHGA